MTPTDVYNAAIQAELRSSLDADARRVIRDYRMILHSRRERCERMRREYEIRLGRPGRLTAPEKADLAKRKAELKQAVRKYHDAVRETQEALMSWGVISVA